MITLAHFWILILLPVPFVVFRLLPAYRESRVSIRVPRLRRMAGLTGRQPSSGAVILSRSTIAWFILAVSWACALAALARPQLIGNPVTRNIPARDLLLAVDLSGSMETRDFLDAEGNQVDRLTACKQVLDEFLTRREGDRVGLIFFGSAAFVQAPFTEDLELCRTLLDEAQVRMAGPQTVIGDAIGLALSVFERSDQEDRVLILLTDGNDTGSQVPPAEAARIAKDQGVTIHTIAVGDPEAVGEEKLDEEALEDIAQATGGGFFRANDREQLEAIYQRLDQLESRELETESYRPKTDLYYWPLGGFLLIGLCYYGFHTIRQPNRIAKGTSSLAAAIIIMVAIFMTGAAEPNSDADMVSGFHFIRPAWLLAFLPATLIVLALLRRQDTGHGLAGIIEPHLLDHLIVRPTREGWFRPVQLLAVSWCLATVALAGPTWTREPSPFANDQAAIIFVQEVSPTMLAQDIQPSRLQRSVHKIRDLLALRPGAESALIAYSGSAHLVMPITGDAEIIESFANELDPRIMPIEGDVAAEAIALANTQLTSAARPGSIVLITDGIDASQNEELEQLAGMPIHILAVAGDQSKPLPVGSPPAPAIDLASLDRTANAARASLTLVTVDDQDVQTLSRKISTSFIAVQQNDGGARWKDTGYWLTPLIALIAFFWFRPGWVVKWE